MRVLSQFFIFVMLILGAFPGGHIRVAAQVVGGVIEGGQATISQPNVNSTVINQQSDRAVAGFDQFNLGVDDRFLVNQPGSHAILWVKDYQAGPSQLNGRIEANGQVWISNANGILVGETGRIDTAGTLLTSSFMRNQDFMAGTYDFTLPGNPSAAVINEGLITARDAGLVGLVAPGVVNDGIIYARLGRVTLASGNRFIVDVRGDGLFRFAPDDEVLEQVIDHRTGEPLRHLVSNNGLIHAPGGLVALSAVNTRLLLDSVIDNSGRVLAPTYETQVGKVTFSTALPSQQRAIINANSAPPQKITVSGEIDVSGRGANQTGGEIRILGEVIGLTEARLDASGDTGGGLVLVGGTYFGDKLTLAEKIALGVRNPGELIQASRETVMLDSVILADALSSGDGGQVVVRAEERAAIQGEISVQGENGLVDTSGLEQLILDVDIDVANPFGGPAGHWGIDPGNVTIDELIPDGSFVSPFNTVASVNIAAKDIEAVLDAGGDVHILTDGGRIDVDTDIQKTSGDESTIRFDSTDGFTLASGTKIERVLTGDYETNRADLNVIIDGNTDRNGTGTTQIDGEIITLGGDVVVRGQRITLSGGAIQTLNDPDGIDGNVDVIADVTAPFPAWAVISLSRQAITAGIGRVYVEARSLATDDTVSFGGREAIRTTGLVTVTADKLEVNPSATPHINVGPSSPDPVLVGTQVRPVVIGRTYIYTPQTPPSPTVDNPPTVGTGTLLNHTISEGDSFSYTLPGDTFADDAGATTLTLAATGLPTGLTFSDNTNGTGTVTGTPTTTGTFTITVTATDTSGQTVQRTFRIVVEAGVTPPPPTTNTPPTATSAGVTFSYTAGQNFSFTTPIDMFSDDNGVANLTLTVLNLQTWMTFVDNGDGTATISGTPPDTNTYRPTVVATDAGGLSVQKAVRFEVSVTPPPPPTTNTAPTIGGATFPDQFGPEGQRFDVTTSTNLFVDDGGAENLSLTISGLPPGLTFQDNGNGTGTYSGAATTAGVFVVTLTATDAGGLSVSRTLVTITISPAPPPPPTVNDPPTATTTAVLFAYTAGQRFSFTTSASMFSDDGGVANLTLTALNLQSWMTFVDNGNGTATISGTPPDTNTYRPTVVATDAGGLSAQKAVRFEVGVTPPPPPTTNTPPTAGTGTLVNQTATTGLNFSYTTGFTVFADDGGVNNLRLTSGAVPNGLSFQDNGNGNGTGTLLGNPSVSGAFTVTVTATDSGGLRYSRSFVVVIETPTPPPPQPTTDLPPTASTLSTFTHTASIFGDVSLAVSRAFFSDDNGNGNLTLSLRSGFSPPNGTSVSISRDGTLVVSGTIRRPGTYFVPVEATDASGQSVARTFIIVFDPGSAPEVTTVDPGTSTPVIVTPVVHPDPLPGNPGATTNPELSAVDPSLNDVTQTGNSNPNIPRSLSSHPAEIRLAIVESGLIGVAIRDPNFNNFSLWENRFGPDATVEFLYAYKQEIEGKTPIVAAREVLATESYQNSQLAKDLSDAGLAIYDVTETILDFTGIGRLLPQRPGANTTGTLRTVGNALVNKRINSVDGSPPKSTLLVKQHSDGSFRTPDGKFASKGGLPSPGTKIARDYTQSLRKKGFEVVGEELTVKGAVGNRRYDAVIRDDKGKLWGVEYKSGGGSKNTQQEFNDMFINEFGAAGVGQFKGENVIGNITIFL